MPAMTERDLLNKILLLCTQLRLRKFHDFSSVRNSAGWPDVVVGGPGGMLVRELKDRQGQLTPEQRQWLLIFHAAGVDTAVWRPADWTSGLIQRELEALALSTPQTAPERPVSDVEPS